MKFHVDDAAASPEQEWVSRVNPWLLADDPHQACCKRAIDDGALFVGPFCDCPKPTECDKECCR